MDEIIRVAAEYAVEFAVATVAPIAIVLFVKVLRKAAAKTPNKLDDQAAEALADAINRRGAEKRGDV